LYYTVSDNITPIGVMISEWVDQVNYTAQKAWKALHFLMHVLRKGHRNTKSLAYITLVHPILEYGSASWDPCRG